MAKDWKTTLQKPFVNLTPRARFLQFTRLGFPFACIVFLLFIIVLNLTRLPVARLDCSHVDVSKGLFTALQSSVSSSGEQIQQGSSVELTTSQVLILSDYVTDQVANAPQFIDSNLMNWCFGNYNLTEKYHAGKTHYEKELLYRKCTHVDKNYVFDYRGELSVIGLNIILAYAYTDSSFSAQSLTDTVQYQPDDKYIDTLAQRRRLTRAVPGLFYATAVLQVHILVFGIVYYGKRNYEKNDTKMPMAARQAFAVLSLAAFLTFLVGLSLTTKVYTDVRKSVKMELGDFGLSVHLGKSWFGLAWTNFFFCLFSMLGWCGPLWCGNVEPKSKRSENTRQLYLREREYIGTPIRRRQAEFDPFGGDETLSSEESLIDLKRQPTTLTIEPTRFKYEKFTVESPVIPRDPILGPLFKKKKNHQGTLLTPRGIPRSNSKKVINFRDDDMNRDIFLDGSNGLVYGDEISFEDLMSQDRFSFDDK